MQNERLAFQNLTARLLRRPALRGTPRNDTLLCYLFLNLSLFFLIIPPRPSEAQQNLRAWYARGQTFLLWEHSGTPPRTYEVYTASQPIRSLRNAVWAERVVSAEAANRRVWDLLPNAQRKLPDTAGGTVTVGLNESYAALTPLAQESIYVAVVRTGDTVVTSANTAGPVRQRVEVILPTVQYQDTSVTIYGHWIDGRADYNGGRTDYPPMANRVP